MDGCCMATWVAIAWLLYRIWHCMRIPFQDFLEAFNISVSEAKMVSVEEITEDSVILGWENEAFDQRSICSVLYYSLFVNGLKVGSFPNHDDLVYTYCSVKNLKPGTEYKIDVITVSEEGFVTKIPSLYFMTRSSNLREGGKDVEVYLRSDNNLCSKLVPGLTSSLVLDAEWQTSKLVSKCDPKCKLKQDSPCSSFTSIVDLDGIPISRLKQILLCSQAELHEIVLQQDTITREFDTARDQLLLELEELKHRWNQEAESRRSLKTVLKSLENSKVQGDLKKNKLIKQLARLSSDIQKMRAEMEQWEQEQEELDVDLLEKKYNASKQAVERHFLSVKEELADIQKELLLLEAENKQLNHLRKNWCLTKEEHNTANYLVSPQSLMKKFTIFGSGLNGDELRQDMEFLKGLPQDIPIVQFLKEQISKDLELEVDWNARYSQYLEQIAQLFKIRDDISMTNKRYREALATQPYCQPPSHIVEPVAKNADTIGPVNIPPHLQLHDPSTYGETEQLSPLFLQNLVNVYPQHSGNDYVPWAQQQKSHIESKDDKSLSNGYFPVDEETPFGDDDSSHLLSSLKSMISEPETQNDTSTNTFTTNELDNYWNHSNSYVPGDRREKGVFKLADEAVFPIAHKPMLRNPSSSRTIESIKFMKQDVDDGACDAPLLYNIDDSQSEGGTPSSLKMQQQDSYIKYLPQIKDGTCSPEPNFYSVNFNIWHEVTSSDPNATLSPSICSDTLAIIRPVDSPQLHLQAQDMNNQPASKPN